MASLMGGTATYDPNFERAPLQARQLARQAWAIKRAMELVEANNRADAAWDRLLAPYQGWDDADIPDLAPPPEQAQADIIVAEINEAVDHDRWPANLYWSL